MAGTGTNRIPTRLIQYRTTMFPGKTLHRAAHSSALSVTFAGKDNSPNAYGRLICHRTSENPSPAFVKGGITASEIAACYLGVRATSSVLNLTIPANSCNGKKVLVTKDYFRGKWPVFSREERL